MRSTSQVIDLVVVTFFLFLPEGKVLLEEIEDRYNDTPFWVIQVPREISSDHGDIINEHISDVVVQMMERNSIFNPDVRLKLLMDFPRKRWL